MGLAQQQAALARLCTDAKARMELQSDPATFAQRHSLEEAEASDLAKSVLRDTESFALSLLRKRHNEATRALSEVQSVIHRAGFSEFAEYARDNPIAVCRNPALDGCSYLSWLHQRSTTLNLSRRERDYLNYTRARITMEQTQRRCLVQWLYVPNSGVRRRSICIWLRLGHGLRFWCI